MNTLHLLNKSPFLSNTFDTVLVFIHEHDGILLTGDAVYALQPNTVFLMKMKQLPVTIYALNEDMTARAIDSTLDNIKTVDYSAFVRLCTEYKKVVTWS